MRLRSRPRLTVVFLQTSIEGLCRPTVWMTRGGGSDSHPLLPALDRDVSKAGWARDGQLFISCKNRVASVMARIMFDQHAVGVVSQMDDDDAVSLADNGIIKFTGTACRRLRSPICAAPQASTHFGDDVLRRRALGVVSSSDIGFPL